MPCYTPLTAWRSKTDYKTMVFDSSKGMSHTEVKLPCGQCIGCRLARARTWAIRCLHEAKFHQETCFLTLTYNDANLPPNGSLRPKDMVDFFKRLRKNTGVKLRYFQCGEYGDAGSRPHHHCILFGYRPMDCSFYRYSGNYPLYTSNFLQSVWGQGYVTIGELSLDTCMYTARYVTKKITGAPAAEHYKGRIPEYVTMSRRPGIGKAFYDKYKNDMYNHDRCVIRDGLVLKPPKYYDNLFDIDNPDKMRELKDSRKALALSKPEEDYKRQETRARVQLNKLKQVPRKYEGGIS